MRKLGKFLLVSVIIILLVVSISYFWGHNFRSSINSNLRDELIEYCRTKNLCQQYCIVVDYSIFSGRDRLFIVDLPANKIVHSGLCAHGMGLDGKSIVKPRFSNEVGSYLSSLGHFKTGRSRKTQQFDLNAIELHGLDSSNSNACVRGILLHNGMPDIRIVGVPGPPASLGCFTVTGKTLKEIGRIKDSCNKPLLLYSTDKSVF